MSKTILQPEKRQKCEKYQKCEKCENGELINIAMGNNKEIKKYAKIMYKTILQHEKT